MKPHSLKDIFIHMVGHKGFDYDQITDEIFIGTNMCCQYGFSKELLSKGVRADISLEENRTDAPGGVDYFLWLPTENGKAPSPKDLEIGINFLDSLVKKRVKTFVHCKNGHGRAPTLVAAYFIMQGMTIQKAIDFIASKRPVIHFTESQRRALREFELRKEVETHAKQQEVF